MIARFYRGLALFLMLFLFSLSVQAKVSKYQLENGMNVIVK